MVVERNPGGRHAAEDEAAIALSARHAQKTQLFFAQRIAIGVLIGNACEFTIIAISPAMIGTAERTSITLCGLAYSRGAMAASI
jgi:hypothetical protein